MFGQKFGIFKIFGHTLKSLDIKSCLISTCHAKAKIVRLQCAVKWEATQSRERDKKMTIAPPPLRLEKRRGVIIF